MAPKKSNPTAVKIMKKASTLKFIPVKFARGPENIKAQAMLTNNYLVITSPHHEMVKKLKLTTRVRINEATYPRIMREFYENLAYYKYSLQITMKGTTITITPVLVREIVDLPMEGLVLRKRNDISKEEVGYDANLALH